MIYIDPITVNEDVLEFSNVADDDDTQEFDFFRRYNVGDRVRFENDIYEKVEGEEPRPRTTPDKDPTFILVGAINRFRMFDTTLSSRTTNDENININLRPNQSIDSIALFGLQAISVRIRMDDVNQGNIYDETFVLADFGNVNDFNSYYFDDVDERKEELLILDLPKLKTAVTTVTIDNSNSEAQCAELVIGRQQALGVANFSTSIGIRDFSIKQRDIFGNTRIVERRSSKTADYDVTIETANANNVQRKLTSIRARPVVWVGDVNRPETIIYGFYKNFSIVLDQPSISSASIEVEGLA